MEIKNNIHKYRVWRGLTQRELAKQAGVHYATILNTERGKHTLNLKNRKKICKCLGVSYDQIFYKEA